MNGKIVDIIRTFEKNFRVTFEVDSIDELNEFLLECKADGVNEEILGVLSRVFLYNEVIEHVRKESYRIVDFDAETSSWNCGYGGDITNDYDKGMAVFDFGFYNPFDFEMNEDIYDWIDWENVWVNATTEGWSEVTFNDRGYLVCRR